MESNELLVSAKLAHSKCHGITCGTAGVIEIGTPQVPWNSMELLMSSKLAHSKFHGIPWNCSCERNWRTSSSMGFHRNAHVIEIGAFLIPWNSMQLLMSVKSAHLKFHGIPWNSIELLVSTKLEFHGTAVFQRNWRTPNSMELLFFSEIGAPQFPWNSM